MNKEVLALLLKYPELSSKLDAGYRKELFWEWLKDSVDTTIDMNKTQEAAFLYEHAKSFGIAQAQKLIAQYLEVKPTTMTRRLSMARDTGLIRKKQGYTLLKSE